MSEHNKNFYSLEEVERCLEASEEFQDGEEIYYFIGALRYVYDENKQLKSQLQQKENIIKEVREYIEEHKQKGYRIPMSDDYDFWNELNENEIKELLKILDKGE